MLRKVLWSGLYAGVAAGFALASRKLAEGVWRVTTGDSPPVTK